MQQKYLSKNPAIRFIIKKFTNDLHKVIKKTKARNVLEVGCGEGVTTIKTARRFPHTRFLATDLEKGNTHYASKINTLKNLRFKQADALTLNFKEYTFDLVLCNEVIEHIKDYQTAIKNLIDHSSKYIIISVPNEPWFRIGNMLRFKYLKSFGNTPGHINNWSKSKFKKILSKHAEVLEIKTSIFWNIALLKKF